VMARKVAGQLAEDLGEKVVMADAAVRLCAV
jgi:hypothetical protein